MISCPIYDKNGVVKNAVIDTLELHDEWMAECYVTASVKSPVPIDFEVGDYILYRGEQYTIQYSPNLLKKAAPGSYQEGFVYDNIKFVGSQDDVVRCDFNDIVLNDNEMHYTALSTFPFYCESVDDLLDRIQANLEDLYPGQWIIIGLNTVRNYQRGNAVGRASAFDEAYRTYVDPTGTAKTDPYGKQGVAESVDNITCWDAMKKVHDDFDLNFIVRGRVIIVGTAGVFTANTFRYGKGNGLYEIERVGDSDQQIVTRLRAYGSETNLPSHYYATLNKQVYATVTTIKNKFGTTGADFLLDLDFDRKYFTYRSESYPGTTESPNYIIEMMANDVAVRGYVTKDSQTGKCYVYCESVAGDDDRDEPDAENMAAFVQALTENDRLDFVDYVNKDTFGEGHYDYSSENLPDNMAVSRLMLPGFPNQSLDSWVQAHKNLTGFEWLAQAVADGFTFSTDKYRPYIDSPNISQYGIRPASIYFDGSDETDDIHPTIEGMEYDNAPVDEVYAADQVEDNGVYPTGDEVKNINITLPDLGFELDKVYEEGASIDMKNGMCGARSFKISKKPTKDTNNRWVCNVERVHDESLDLWFPYCDFQIHGSSEQGREHGDKYVLTGITMPDAYIDFAAVKLLRASIEALKKNHAPRYTYQPRIDEIFMQRQHDTALKSQGVVSLHDTLKAGDIFSFADTDLNIDENIIIDVLTIRENGNNGIPTYDITLRDEKEVSTIQKITNKVDSIISGATSINGATGGLTVQQVRSIINNFGGAQFLSKLNDDTAAGYITMLKGLQIGANFVPDILGEGGCLRMRQDGKVELVTDILYTRMRAYFDSVVIREYRHESGNRIKSPAQGFNASRVEYIKVVSGVETIVEDASEADIFRCYWRVDDGEKKAENQFIIGDLAFCEHSDVVDGTLVTKRYWRVVTGRNAGNTTTADGEAWIDLSNAHDVSGNPVMATITYTGQGGSTQTKSVLSFESGSDVPEAHDDICMLGCVVDETRQGAIIEYVSGTNAPSYQIYQSVGSDATNPYVLTNKNQITIGYNSATGKADMKVYGDAYIGARDRSTFIEFKQDDGTEQHNPALNIKAKIQTLPNSTYEGKTASQFVQDNQLKYDTDIQNLTNITNDLQSQIDGEIVSWFYEGTPTLDNAPAVDWNTDTLKERHLGDMYYDVGTGVTSGFAYRFIKSEQGVYDWQYIDDTAITLALAKAAEALGLAGSKAKTYTTANNVLPSAPYNVGDLWLNATGTWESGENAVTWENEILKCIKACPANGTPDISDWAKASKYTDDSAFNGYINAFLNGSGASGDSATAAAIQKAIASALGSGIVVDGGLLLTSLIGMRQYNGSGDKSDVSNYTTWAGISGQYNANVLGGGIAAWYGGGMLDKETLGEQISQGWNTLRWAKGVDRFDGSGYRADGNISWNANGALTIKNITTLSDSNNNNILNELATFNSAFTFGTSGQGSTTALYITPQVPFQSLYIGTSNADKQEVATKNWVNQNFVTTTFFDNLFRVYNGSESSANKIAVNGTLPSDTANLNIEAMFGFWTKKYISALGQGDDGSTSYTTLAQLNDVTLTNPTANQILVYDGTHWRNQNQQSVYELPTASADTLGGVKVGTTLAISSGVLNLPTTGVTAGTYKRVTVDAYGRVTSGDNTDTDTNTWRNIYVGGTSKVGTGIDTKAINFKAGSNVSLSFAAAGTGSGQSGNANYFDVVISATDTTYSAATQSVAGLMSAADKKKLDGIAEGANKYSLPLAANGTRGGVQIGFTTDAANRNYAVQLSNEKMYVNVPWENTWRGIQNNLTSQSTTDSLSAYQGYLLANGSARDNTKLPLTGGTLTGTLTARDVVVQSAYTLKIGDAILKWDSANNALKLYKLSGSSEVAVNFYATGGVSALGMSEDGSAGAGDVTWALLADGTDTRQIALSHLTTSLTTITGGTTDSTNKKYAVYKNSSNQLFVDVPWQAGAGTVTSIKVGTTSYTPTNGVISLPAYPTSLPASDVYSWAKQSTKPTYAYSEITGTPTIPAAANNGTFSIKTLVGSTTTTISDFTANQSTADDFTLVQGANVTFTLDTTNRKLTIAAKDTTYTLAGLMGSSAKGSTTQPIYWNGSAFANTSYTLGKSVPSDAKFTDTTYSANNGVGLSGTTFYNSGVRATTINGNYLRVNTNGTNADLTIPYATSAGNADTVDSEHLSAWTYPTSPRNFVNGTLIKTDIDYSLTNGDAFFMEIAGDTYFNLGSMLTLVQGYIYNDTIISFSVNNLGRTRITELYAMNVGGKLCFWFPRLEYWQSYRVGVYRSSAGNYWKNVVISITDSAKPSGTKEVSLHNTLYTNAYVDSNVASATKATQDSDGNAINTTYLKLGGGTMTGGITCSTSGKNLVWGNITIYGGGSNGGVNSIYIGDDVTIGDCNVGGSFGMKSTGANAGFRFFNSSGNSIGGIQSTAGTLQWINSAGTAYNILDANNSSVSKSGETLTVKINGTSHSLTNTNTTYSASTGLSLSSTAFSIDSTYQTYISHGESAYNWGNHANAGYLLKSGGTMTGAISRNGIFAQSTNGYAQLHIDNTYTILGYDNPEHSIPTYIDGYKLYFRAGTNHGTKMFIDNNGYVGIGTETPSRILDVASISRFGSYIEFGNYAGTGRCGWVGRGQSENNIVSLSAENAALNFIANGALVMSLSANGSLGTCSIGGNIVTNSNDGTYVQIGAIRLQYDSTNNAIKVVKSDGNVANIYATGGISALGAGQESGGGGSYLPLSGGTLTGQLSINKVGYALKWNNDKYSVGSNNSPNNFYIWSEDSTARFRLGTNNLERLTVLANGNIGIGTQSPNFTLDINGYLYSKIYYGSNADDSTSSDYRWGMYQWGNVFCISTRNASNNWIEDTICINLANRNVGIGANTPSYKLQVFGSVGATSYNNTSDIRKKNVIKDVTLRLDQIAKAPAFEYYWLDPSIDHDLHVGTSAQYWESVMPEVVTRAKDEIGTLSMQYGVAALISAITVARKVMTHEEEIALLETRVSALEKENGEQEQLINSLQEELAKFKAA